MNLYIKAKLKCSTNNGRSYSCERYHSLCNHDPSNPNYYDCPRYQEARDKIPNVVRGLPYKIFPIKIEDLER